MITKRIEPTHWFIKSRSHDVNTAVWKNSQNYVTFRSDKILSCKDLILSQQEVLRRCRIISSKTPIYPLMQKRSIVCCSPTLGTIHMFFLAKSVWLEILASHNRQLPVQ